MELTNRVRFSIIIISLFAVMSCGVTSDNSSSGDSDPYNLTKSIDVGPFTFSAPEDIEEVEVQGFDSLVKKYMNSDMEISVDYGWYSGWSYGSSGESIEVDNKKALFLSKESERPEYKFFSIIHFYEVDSSVSVYPIKLNVTISSNRDDALSFARALFMTIKFKQMHVRDIHLVGNIAAIDRGAPYGIMNASISDTTLSFTVEYSGGCAEHFYELYISSLFLESSPVQAEAVLTHDDPGDRCDGLIREEIHFNITKLKELYMNQYNENEGTIHIILNQFNGPIEYKF